MQNIQADIQQLVDGFVTQVTTLARRAAIDTLAGALGENGTTVPTRTISAGPLTLAPAQDKRGKRTEGDLAELQDKLYTFVKGNPGLRIEQINKQLGTTTKELALPIRKMIADGELKSKGNKRSTVYFAGKTKN